VLFLLRGARRVVAEAPFLLRVLRDELDAPLRLLVLFDLERLLVDRRLEDLVVWAIVVPSSLASLPAIRSRRPCIFGSPAGRCLKRPFRVSGIQD
jgi:hypothetical protein